MPHSFSYAVSMNLEHSIKEGSHERYPDHFQSFRNIKKIKYPDFSGHDIDNNFYFIFGSDQLAERIWIMILGIPHPTNTLCTPFFISCLSSRLGPLFGLGGASAHFRPSNLCPLTWALLIAMSHPQQ